MACLVGQSIVSSIRWSYFNFKAIRVIIHFSSLLRQTFSKFSTQIHVSYESQRPMSRKKPYIITPSWGARVCSTKHHLYSLLICVSSLFPAIFSASPIQCMMSAAQYIKIVFVGWKIPLNHLVGIRLFLPNYSCNLVLIY